MNNQTKEFVTLHANDDVRDLALQRSRFPEVEWDLALQQIEGHQLMQKKLPSISNIDGWLYPKRLSLEQCSSETTARYKMEAIKSYIVPEFQSSKALDSATMQPCNVETFNIADLTGGFGIDSFFLSQLGEVDYVEQQTELCNIAEHNFRLTQRPIRVHNTTAEEFLLNYFSLFTLHFSLIYLDPARRGGAGQKVFRLEDCTPNVLELMPLLRQRCRYLLLKLSPMIDLNLLQSQLPEIAEIHVVAVQNEVKEVLVLLDFTTLNSQHPTLNSQLSTLNSPVRIVCQNLLRDTRETFIFTPEEESQLSTINSQLSTLNFLFEPNAAILKAGAFKTVAARFNLQKLDPNTHLYTSQDAELLIPNSKLLILPGRCFRILKECSKADLKSLKGKHLNVLTRNYPISADKLQKQLGIVSGGEQYLIGARLNSTPKLWIAELV